jgi:hypothetical protein
MALTSPGVEVSIVDESQYIPAATNSVPYILLATAQNKVSGAGVGIAAGTLEANSNKTYLISSQRDLLATFGVPFFYKTTAGTPINGYELNEYGLLAAWSALGISNRCYVQRANIDLAELTATLVRPTGNPANGTYWLDTANTSWGIFQWNKTTAAFTNQIPTVITSTTDLQSSSSVPLNSIGNIGDYAVVTVGPEAIYNLIYYKRGGPTNAQAPGWLQDGLTAGQLYNTWVLLGSDAWKTAWPTIQGTAFSTLTAGSFAINDTTVTVSNGNTALDVATTINGLGISGVYAAAVGNALQLFAESFATNDGSSLDDQGIIAINNVSGTPLATMGITAGQYAAPEYLAAPSFQVPRWRSTDPEPEPTGSVWIKTSNVNQGTNIVIKRFDATLGTFVQQACPVFLSDTQAIFDLDPSGGGKNIPAGSTYARVNPYNAVLTFFDPPTHPEASFEILERFSTGPTIITGNTTTPGPFVSGNNFELGYTTAGVNTLTFVTVTLSGTTVADFLTSISAALPSGAPVTVAVNSSGAIVFTHVDGGDIFYYPGNNSFVPLTAAGFIPGDTRGVRAGNGETPLDYVILANWVSTPTFTYTASNTAPDQDPADGRLWYYSSTNEADIMIQNLGAWVGYQTVANDVRGDNLTLTNATGPIFAATAPTTQTDDSQSPLEYGDLWIDTSDLENYPLIYRWSEINGTGEWVQIDNTDQTTENGILFADARWAPNGTTNPITDPIPPIASGATPLITSNYLDLDAPNPNLYPQGMLLFNTRRSGFNVKSFQTNYLTPTNYPTIPAWVTQAYPTQTNSWVTASANKADGSPNMGRLAQRSLIVAAMKSGIDTSTTAREEQVQFNLISCPQYPELTINLVALNNERDNTAFVIADTPLRLTPTEIVNFTTNNSGLGLPAQDGLTTGSIYAATFYPSCQTTDLSGSPVVQPPSHMMIRTIIRSDEVAYPWLAPAGTRRGVVDNATQIGYVQAETGEFVSLGVNQGLRDTLYENRVNPITFVPGVGITNFGNKTLTSLDSALDRINVARLVAFIRGRLESIANQFLFEPNDQITRNEITNAITSLMIDLVAKRGIYDYLVVCDLTNNTPARIDRNELYVDIAIEPVKAVEFIYIPVRIKNTGEIASQSV